MPEYLHLPPVAQAVLTITGVVLAVVRLLTASKSFWWRFPEWLQKGLPAALVALGTLPRALELANSWLDVVVAFVLAVGAWFTASRGDKRPVEPPSSGSAPLLPVLCLFALIGLVAQPALMGCTPQQRVASADVVAKGEALAFNGATIALLLLDDAEAHRLDAIPRPTPEQLAASELRLERLTRARDALAVVRRALAGELGDLDERDKLREAVKAIDLVAAELSADGVNLPADIQKALAAARVVL